MTSEAVLARTMVELAGSLVNDDLDIIELLTTLSDRCVIMAVNATPRTLEDMNMDGPLARLDSADDGTTR